MRDLLGIIGPLLGAAVILGLGAAMTQPDTPRNKTITITGYRHHSDEFSDCMVQSGNYSRCELRAYGFGGGD